MNKRVLLSTLFFMVLTSASWAQVDSLFGVAKNFAFNGQRELARTICDTILVKSPKYTDVRLLKGRTFSWDGKRDSAKIEFYKILAYDSANAETWGALSDVTYWDDNYSSSLNAADSGIIYNPKNTELMLKRTRALIDLSRFEDARNTLQNIKQIDTACTGCKPLQDKLYRASALSNAGYGFTAEYFAGLDRLLMYHFFQFGHKSPKNSVIFRINYNQRDQSTGFQPEIDMYPTVSKKAYLYVNYGFSIYDVFPRHRIGLELYHKIPSGFEGSIGGRYMDFGTNSKVYIFTGSLTKYIGNYAIIFRPFITPDEITKKVSQSGILNLRRYTLDADNFVGLTFGAGFSPDQRIFLTGTGVTNERRTSIYFLQSYRAGIMISKTFKFRHLFIADFDYRYQELKVGPSSQFYNTYSGGVSYRYRF